MLVWKKNRISDLGEFFGSGFKLSSSYGKRTDPISGEKSKHHSGVDFSAPKGTPIKSTISGTVVYAKK